MRNLLDYGTEDRPKREDRATRIIRLTRERDRLFAEADREYEGRGLNKTANHER